METAAGVQLYFSSGDPVGGGTQEIYVSQRRADGSFGPRAAVASLNSGTDDAMPNVRKDGLEVVFTSTRAGGEGAFDIWSSTRSTVFSTWSTAVNLGTAVNTTGSETRPSFYRDATRLYFGRSGDIFVSTR